MTLFKKRKRFKRRYKGVLYTEADLITEIYREADRFGDKDLGRDFIEKALKVYFPNHMTKKDEKKWAFITGIGYGLSAGIFALVVPSPTNFQYQTFRFFSSLAAAGFMTFVPGFLEIQIQATARNWIKAGGAIAGFVLVYFFLAK